MGKSPISSASGYAVYSQGPDGCADDWEGRCTSVSDQHFPVATFCRHYEEYEENEDFEGCHNASIFP